MADQDGGGRVDLGGNNIHQDVEGDQNQPEGGLHRWRGVACVGSVPHSGPAAH